VIQLCSGDWLLMLAKCEQFTTVIGYTKIIIQGKKQEADVSSALTVRKKGLEQSVFVNILLYT
jgi:hypothetical protein